MAAATAADVLRSTASSFANKPQSGVADRQKKLGPAPFASFEDLSPEGLSSPEDLGYRPIPNLPEIVEEKYGRTDPTADNYEGTSASTSTAQTPTTPRIDVEHASSPSQGESDDSTPEREIFGLLDRSGNVSSAFLEGAADVDLRSSAEELYFPFADKSGRRSNSPALNLEAAIGQSIDRSTRKVSWDAGDHRTTTVQVHCLERKGSGSNYNRHAGDPFFFPSRGTRLSSVSSNMSAGSGLSGLSSFSRRSPSPHRMLLETSFVGLKTANQRDENPSLDDQDDEELVALGRRALTPTMLDPFRSSSAITSPMSPSFHRGLMVKYITEPRSRPTSPISGISSPAASPMPTDSNRLFPTTQRLTARRSSSPARTLVETSFCGHMQIQVPQEETAPRGPSPVPSLSSLSVTNSSAVRYMTEPRSRPASPLPATTSGSVNLSTPSMGAPERRDSLNLRSPSPCRMLLETSFCGPKRIPRQESQDAPVVTSPVKKDSEGHQEATHPSFRRASEQLLIPKSPLKPVIYHREPRSRSPSPCPPPVTIPAVIPSTVTVEPDFTTIRQRPAHLKTFETEKTMKNNEEIRKGSSASSEGTLSPPSQRQNGTNANMVVASPSKNSFLQSPNTGRHMPKPVACPKPPPSYSPCHNAPDSSQNSPLMSPTIGRRVNSGQSTPNTTAPSSPFVIRKSSFSNVFRRSSNVSNEDTKEVLQSSKTGSSDTLRSDGNGSSLGDATGELSPADAPASVVKADKKEGKSRNVLSVLFGKKNGKKDSKKETTNSSRPNLDAQFGIAEKTSNRTDEDVDEDDGSGFEHQVLGASGVLDQQRINVATSAAANHSDSDKESDAEGSKVSKKGTEVIEHEPEKHGLVSQDSVDDELPYVPTTLPIEKPVAPVITPVRMRMAELKTAPVQRPRCSVTIGPCSISDYIKIVQAPCVGQEEPETSAQTGETQQKIKVIIPRRESSDDVAPVNVPVTRVTLGSIKWETFAEQALRSPRNLRRTQFDQQSLDKNASVLRAETRTGAELAAASKPVVKMAWVNVEEIPEPVKQPKKIHMVDGRKTSIAAVDEKVSSDIKHEEKTPIFIGPVDEQIDDEHSSGPMRKLSDGELRQRKDSVSSETALLREIDDPEAEVQVEEDRLSAVLVDDGSMSINGRQSHSSSLEELGSNLDDGGSAVDELDSTPMCRSNMLSVAPFGMDLDVRSNRSSVAIASDAPSPEEELFISTSQAEEDDAQGDPSTEDDEAVNLL